ncbi:MAG TPA: alpha/beta fold hydrolase [Anaerolineae bacterium]|nr:alpha/beta fold hydrolase [Anaerolineae bacterium]
MSATKRKLVTIMLLGMVVTAALGFGAAVAEYDRVTRVPADCDERFGDNSPSAWSIRGIGSAVPDFDGSRWFAAGYHEVRIPSRDPGIELRAWWLPPRGGPTAGSGPSAGSVVVIHGFGTCVRDPVVLAPTGMLHRLGYGVLLFDLRDHGASTVEDGRVAGGAKEYRDVLGAVDWLVDQGAAPDRIGLFGTSMGAASAIIAAGQDERVAAVWAESSYADIMRRIADGLEEAGLPRWLAPIAQPLARIVSGDDIGSPSLPGELANLRGRHLFIVHGTLDGLIDVSHAEILDSAARSAGVLTERWIVADAGHVDAMFVQPDEYERRVGDFFRAAFGS